LTVPPRCGRFGCSAAAAFLHPLETTMISLRRCAASFLAAFVLGGSTLAAAASDTAFPFGSELVLDAPPLPDTKRMPTIEIDEDGAAAFNLWCARVSGSANVTNGGITIVPSKTLSAQCTPERLKDDAALLAALSQVTNWHRNGDVVDFVGVTPLRFRLMTN
jgi:heat shock protein HslJ